MFIFTRNISSINYCPLFYFRFTEIWLCWHILCARTSTWCMAYLCLFRKIKETKQITEQDKEYRLCVSQSSEPYNCLAEYTDPGNYTFPIFYIAVIIDWALYLEVNRNGKECHAKSFLLFTSFIFGSMLASATALAPSSLTKVYPAWTFRSIQGYINDTFPYNNAVL